MKTNKPPAKMNKLSAGVDKPPTRIDKASAKTNKPSAEIDKLPAKVYMATAKMYKTTLRFKKQKKHPEIRNAFDEIDFS